MGDDGGDDGAVKEVDLYALLAGAPAAQPPHIAAAAAGSTSVPRWAGKGCSTACWWPPAACGRGRPWQPGRRPEPVGAAPAGLRRSPEERNR